MPQPLWEGDIFAGKYRVEAILGKGGMGMVLGARHLGLDEPVAIKVLLPDVVAMPGKRLINRIVDDLKHHVVQPGAIVRIADIHTRTLANRLQPFKYLNAADAIIRAPVRLRLVHRRLIWNS